MNEALLALNALSSYETRCCQRPINVVRTIQTPRGPTVEKMTNLIVSLPGEADPESTSAPICVMVLVGCNKSAQWLSHGFFAPDYRVQVFSNTEWWCYCPGSWGYGGEGDSLVYIHCPSKYSAVDPGPGPAECLPAKVGRRGGDLQF